MTRTTEAVLTAAGTLASLSDRMSRAAQSLARMVARLATEDDPTKVVTSIAKYVNSGMPEAEAVADVAAVIGGRNRRSGGSGGRRCGRNVSNRDSNGSYRVAVSAKPYCRNGAG